MSASALDIGQHSPPARRAAYAYAGVAAAAMVCTLPGRTHGLGLITEPLLADLTVDRVAFATINLWATLAGALFCVPCGWLIDRLGIRPVLSGTLLALGTVVLLMTRMSAQPSISARLPAFEQFSLGDIAWLPVPLDLFVLILLTRGLGQSALSVVSLALVGRAAGRNAGPVIGVYSFLVAIGFMLAFAAVKVGFERWHLDWRQVWGAMGVCLIAAGVAALVFARTPATPRPASGATTRDSDYSFGAALLTPAFWTFGIATSFYGFVVAGMSLFNQSLLAERHFDRSVFLTITIVSPLIGLAANLATGFLATYVRQTYLLAAALTLQAAALAAFPLVTELWHVYAYAVAMGTAGGMMTVIFFSVWVQMYGPTHLGKIQGAAQLLTVVASAVGPLLLAVGQRTAGSYAPVLQWLAAISLGLAVLSCVTRRPRREKQ